MQQAAGPRQEFISQLPSRDLAVLQGFKGLSVAETMVLNSWLLTASRPTRAAYSSMQGAASELIGHGEPQQGCCKQVWRVSSQPSGSPVPLLPSSELIAHCLHVDRTEWPQCPLLASAASVASCHAHIDHLQRHAWMRNQLLSPYLPIV